MYTRAITRKPGKNFADGITTSGLGKPDFEKAVSQHAAYCDALTRCGLSVTVLEADEKYPDGCFVEDTAVVTENMAVITKPGNPARLGEEIRIAEILSQYRKTETIQLPGTLDGGDIMRADSHFYIGLSGRTNQEGAGQLSYILSLYGYTSSVITVGTVLHLKTGIAYLGGNSYIAIRELADQFKSPNLICLDPDENYAANCLRVNDYLLIPKGFPKSRIKIIERSHRIIELEMSEFRKMDGGLTCLSLIF